MRSALDQSLAGLCQYAYRGYRLAYFMSNARRYLAEGRQPVCLLQLIAQEHGALIHQPLRPGFPLPDAECGCHDGADRQHKQQKK
jgi:hypothetical protein